MRKPSTTKAVAHKAAGGIRKKLSSLIKKETNAQKDYAGLKKKTEKYDKKFGSNKRKISPAVAEIQHDEATHEHQLKEIEHQLP